MSLKDMFKRGQWSGASTWQRHYNKEIMNNKESSEFETVVLNSALNLGSMDVWFPIRHRLISIIQY